MEVDKYIKTARNVVPMIYAYTTPEVPKHDGFIKIGYTEQDVDERIKEQTHTVDVLAEKQWQGTAIYDDGSGDTFMDHDFHAYLQKLNVYRRPNTEWFQLSPSVSKGYFYDFKSNRGIVAKEIVHQYTLRKEQREAVKKAFDYCKANKGGEFLWNAKPRFGKTLATYDLIKQFGFKNVLIVTNRPAIANSWYDDYCKFMGTESKYMFISSVSSLVGKPHVVDQKTFDRSAMGDNYRRIEFVSLQDLKGSIYFGGKFKKLQHIANKNWDMLVIDEAHEGVDTYKTDVAFDRIKRYFTLHLSGTPFKALANEKFPEEAIYNWTYTDEQLAKQLWDINFSDKDNPYETLPKLNMLTYQMSEVVKDEIDKGKEINGETVEYAFDLNEFFATKEGKFIHSSSVDKFLDALTVQNKYPFSTEKLRNELNHTLWLLNRVDSAKALANKLKKHPVFKSYKVVLAAGDGKLDDDNETKKSYDEVVEAIKKYEKTITLSVGQLTTGVTVPEWSAVLMLSNIKSASLYMQAAFRAQNPCLFKKDNKCYRKENAYVFDFDPARTLVIFEEFANDLSSSTSGGKGDSSKRKENVRQLLNFFPVIGEDESGEMVELDAEKVLSIPRKIKSQEVVKRGFMSDFLFQNISMVFHAPKEVIDIINKFNPAAEPKKNEKVTITPDTAEDLSIDENGEINLTQEFLDNKVEEVFGNKVYETTELLQDIVEVQTKDIDRTDFYQSLADKFSNAISNTMVKEAENHYGDEITNGDKKKIESGIKNKVDTTVHKVTDDYRIKENILEADKEKEIEEADTVEQVQQIKEDYKKKEVELKKSLQEELSNIVDTLVTEVSTDVVETVETTKKEREKRTIEDSVKDHLRGFSRTIPSFLMAYGNEGGEIVTLNTFDLVVPDHVFQEVTSITLDQFRFLRDGGDYVNEETGETEHFYGHIFEPVVFDDSVKEFMGLRIKLGNYFDENLKEDIFDYVPPQKTNQIFTPKNVVKKMVDMLEEENPGCFDQDDKTFMDLYMKSGLYITEIVKRLYNSEVMKQKYPDNNGRLNHIFANQVYGLAPTEIIYRIATNYILGFDESIKIEKHNFKFADALPYAKDNNLEELLDNLYK